MASRKCGFFVHVSKSEKYAFFFPSWPKYRYFSINIEEMKRNKIVKRRC